MSFLLTWERLHAALHSIASQQPVLVVERWQYLEWWRNGVEVNAPAVAPEDGAWVRGGRL